METKISRPRDKRLEELCKTLEQENAYFEDMFKRLYKEGKPSFTTDPVIKDPYTIHNIQRDIKNHRISARDKVLGEKNNREAVHQKRVAQQTKAAAKERMGELPDLKEHCDVGEDSLALAKEKNRRVRQWLLTHFEEPNNEQMKNLPSNEEAVADVAFPISDGMVLKTVGKNTYNVQAIQSKNHTSTFHGFGRNQSFCKSAEEPEINNASSRVPLSQRLYGYRCPYPKSLYQSMYKSSEFMNKKFFPGLHMYPSNIPKPKKTLITWK